MSNIPSKSNSEYPVTILFENARPYFKTSNSERKEKSLGVQKQLGITFMATKYVIILKLLTDVSMKTRDF